MQGTESNKPLLSKELWLIFMPFGTGGTYVRKVNPMPNFHYFIKRWYYNTYEMGIFAELADNGLYGCRIYGTTGTLIVKVVISR